MASQAPQTPKPFWKDDVTPEAVPLIHTQRVSSVAISVFGVLFTLPLVLVSAFLLFLIEPLLAPSWIVLISLLMSLQYLQRRRRARLAAEIADIQQRAKAQAGAILIGSALHVAGHPLLARDQPIVLALQGSQLAIYSPDSSVPLDTIPVSQLQSVQPIVYDDERVPHAGVIDSAAQALQMEFVRDGQTWTVLLRRMLKVRPIDWYHAIQRIRAEHRD